MRPLLISALAATLIGCTCFSLEQERIGLRGRAVDEPQMDRKHLSDGDKAITVKTEHPKYRRKANNTQTKNAKSNIVPKIDASSFVQPDKKSDTVIDRNSAVTAKTETSQSSNSDNDSDPVIKKAKATITARMANRASVEFVEMKRADRKNAYGEFIDTICGHVREKNASGGDTGDRPFLYLVQDDEAYVVGSSDDIIATTAYRNICN
jgi:hypothetical protein